MNLGDHLLTRFFNNYLVSSELWRDMLSNVENSPWHREANTAEHTLLMLKWYLTNVASSRNQQQQFKTVLAIMFHDVGKPYARTEKFSEKRGTYFSFADHERASARLFEDFMLRDNSKFKKMLNLSDDDIFFISFMIENHLPYKYMHNAKRRAIHAKRAGIKTTIVEFAKQHDAQSAMAIFYDLLLADQNGRISDNGVKELEEAKEWIAEFDKEKLATGDAGPLKVHFVVGPQTKFTKAFASELINKIQQASGTIVSDLAFKSQFYLGDHSDIDVDAPQKFASVKKYAAENGDRYINFAQNAFDEILKRSSGDIFFITNDSQKTRLKFASVASKNDYLTVGHVLFDSLDVALNCNDSSIFKKTADAEVNRYMSNTLPIIVHDFDIIIPVCRE